VDERAGPAGHVEAHAQPPPRPRRLTDGSAATTTPPPRRTTPAPEHPPPGDPRPRHHGLGQHPDPPTHFPT
ncbi:hypothetical protein QM596_29655, partial [Rhodococcus sp. IEGM 1406]|nr:hypothetical protein [Rhodococcus sp. IEGM 1406]